MGVWIALICVCESECEWEKFFSLFPGAKIHKPSIVTFYILTFLHVSNNAHLSFLLLNTCFKYLEICLMVASELSRKSRLTPSVPWAFLKPFIHQLLIRNNQHKRHFNHFNHFNLMLASGANQLSGRWTIFVAILMHIDVWYPKS